MPDGSIVLSVSVDDKDAQRQLNNLRRDIQDTEKQIEKTTRERDKTQAALNKADTEHNAIVQQMEDARQAAKDARKEIEALTAQKAENDAALSAQGDRMSYEEFMARQQAQSEINYELEQQNAIVQQSDATMNSLAQKEQESLAKCEEKEQILNAQNEKLAQQNAQLESQKEDIGEIERRLAAQANALMPRIREATQGMSGDFGKAVKNILKWGIGIRSVFILVRRLRSYVKEAVKAFAEQDEATKNTLNTLKSNLASLKVAWGAAFAPIFNAVAPALNYLVDLLTKAANSISMFMAALGGKNTYKRAVANQNALTNSISGTGSAAEETKKQLSGLDEMQTWQGDKSSGGGGSSSAFDYVEESIDITSGVGKLGDFVRQNLESIELLADEFAFVLGMILTLSGASIPLGLGLMVYGGYKLFTDIRDNWGAIKQQLQGTMGEIMGIVNGFLLALGVILLLSGAGTALGLGLMVVGAAGLATTVAANWNGISDKVKSTLSTITGFLGGALLAIGFLLVMAVNPATIALGIGLLALGAASLASSVALNWDSMKNKIEAVVKSIVTVVSGASLAIGAILAFSGVNIPLGIALIAAGAGGLASTKAVSFDGIKKWFNDGFNEISKSVSKWWDEKIKPWFTKEKWESLGRTAATALKGKLTIGDLTFKDWWDKKVAPWFAKEKWANLASTAISNLKSKLSINDGNFVKNWWDKNIAPWFTAQKWQQLATTAVNSLKTKLSINDGNFVKSWWDKNIAPWFTAQKWQTLATTAVNSLKSKLSINDGGFLKSWWDRNIAPWFTAQKWQQLATTAMSNLKSKLSINDGDFLKNWYDKNVSPWFNAQKWQQLASNAIGWLKNALSLGYFNPLGDWFNSYVSPIFQYNTWANLASNAISAIKNSLSLGWFDPISSWYNTYIAPWFQWSTWYNAGSNAISAIINGLKSIVLPSFHIDWGTATKSFSLLGYTYYFNVPWPSISFYARGGIVDKATLFGNSMVGEDGKEAIIPLERHTEWIKLVAQGLADELYNAMPSEYPMPLLATGSIVPPNANRDSIINLDDVITRLDALLRGQERPIAINTNVTAQVDKRTLFSAVVSQGRTERSSTGKNPFNV